MATLILTVIGDDRPGLVQALADVVVRGGGTWKQSSMSRLGTKFAGIVEVDAAEGDADELARELTSIGDDVLHVVVERSEVTESGASSVLSMELVGQDRPGIVHEISEVLADLGVGIDDLETTTSSAPMSAEQLFEARAVLSVPAGVDRTEVTGALETIANELMVDLDLDEL